MKKARPLRPKFEQFINELMSDPDRRVGGAYARVYGVADNAKAHACGRRLMAREDVIAEVRLREEAEKERKGISPEEVVREITLIAKADPRGLFEIHRGACRYCHGVGHLYQRTPREYREAWSGYQLLYGRTDPNGLKFDHQGGVGFDQRVRPHPNCPECFGMGEVYEILKDSRDWPTGAAKLFSGLHRTKDGLKITTRSQDAALKLAAQMRGLLAPEADDPDANVPPPSTINYAAKDGRKK